MDAETTKARVYKLQEQRRRQFRQQLENQLRPGQRPLPVLEVEGTQLMTAHKPSKKAATNQKNQTVLASENDTNDENDENEETTVGFVGVKVDPTPNQNYTVVGVVNNLPTPETNQPLQTEAMNRVGLKALTGTETDTDASKDE